MEREIKRVVGSFVVTAFLLTVGAGLASKTPVEKVFVWTIVAMMCGVVVGLIVTWLVRRS